MNLRKKMQSLRLKMNHEEVYTKSQEIINNLLALPQFQQAQHVLFYYPLGNEVDLRGLMDHALQQNKTIVLPSVNNDHSLDLYAVKDLENGLQERSFKIQEPKASCERIDKDKINLVLVPGVAFDYDCNRIGRGKGHYDRFLKGVAAPKIGVGYEFQVVEKIIPAEHDAPLDLIVTEQKVRGKV